MAIIFAGGKEISNNDNSILFRKKIIGGTVDIAHDCNKTGYYWIDAVQKDPIPPYKGIQMTVRFIVHTIAYDYNNIPFRYQEVIFDSGKYYRGSWQGDDGYSPWFTEASTSLNLDSLASRVSALEKQIGGVLSRLLTHLNNHLVRKVAV